MCALTRVVARAWPRLLKLSRSCLRRGANEGISAYSASHGRNMPIILYLLMIMSQCKWASSTQNLAKSELRTPFCEKNARVLHIFHSAHTTCYFPLPKQSQTGMILPLINDVLNLNFIGEDFL